ncbi:MAG: hypothetical protein MH252_00275 [Thermosynechococcaceae cyanobacterium MS004]|nr:hypothetical protein [Thermosynechococcaceae cyanobacterium MS004]
MNAFSFITEPKTLLGDRSPPNLSNHSARVQPRRTGAISAAAAQHGLRGGGSEEGQEQKRDDNYRGQSRS